MRLETPGGEPLLCAPYTFGVTSAALSKGGAYRRTRAVKAHKGRCDLLYYWCSVFCFVYIYCFFSYVEGWGTKRNTGYEKANVGTECAMEPDGTKTEDRERGKN